jgi:SAM-dependent methyltransferase
MNPYVVWHDIECGRYAADLELWLELAQDAPSGVLDVGAGTGRVALALARAGHRVVALDNDATLLEELAARAAGLPVEPLLGDADAFVLAAPVSLILVPMQTIQLLPARGGFFASAKRALEPGGRVALAIATGLETFDDPLLLPDPDVGDVDGYHFESQPVAIRLEDHGVRIERVRRMTAPDGSDEYTPDAVHLATVTATLLAEEAAEHGLEAEELRHIPETPEHVGSEVVILHA